MKRNAQSTIEYFVILSIIVAALIGMQVYIKRSLQGRLRGYARELAEAAYSPGATNSYSKITTEIQENSVTEEIKTDEHKVTKTTTNIITRQVTNRTEDILSFSDEPARW